MRNPSEPKRALLYRITTALTVIAVCVALIVGVEQAEIVALVTMIGSLIPQVLAVVNTTLKAPTP